jgi:hypothetical protein
MRSVKMILLACIVLILCLATILLATEEVAVPSAGSVMLNTRIGAITDDIAQLESVQESVIPALPNKGTGNLYYVDSVAGSDTYDGTSWTKAEATVNAAVADCTANNGDVIYIAQGSTEDIAGAKGVYLDKAGITVIGKGNGSKAPSFTFSTTGSTFAIGAVGIKVYNCQFIPVHTDVAVGISVEDAADYSSLIDCWFPEPTTSSWEFTKAILLATGAEHITVQNCVSYRETATGAVDWIDAATGIVDDLRIVGNVAVGEYASGVFYSNKELTNVVLVDNCFVSLTTTVPAVNLTAAATGVAIKNYLVGDTWGTLGANIFDPGSLRCFGNLGATAVDKTASPIPSVSQGQTVVDWLAGADGIATWPAAAAPGNAVSISEALRFMAQAAEPQYNREKYFVVTADMNNATWQTVASHEIVDVTGMCKLTIIPECTASVSSVSDNGTIALGDVTTTNSIITASTLGSGVMATGELWVDATLTRTILTQTQLNALTFVVANSKDIGYTIATNKTLTGTIKFHVWWTPLDSTGSCVAGAGGSL